MWRFRVVREGDGAGRPWEVIEQVAFFNEGPDGIERLDLLCSGFHPEPERSSGQAETAETTSTLLA